MTDQLEENVRYSKLSEEEAAEQFEKRYSTTALNIENPNS
jgi:hypothetical protein